MCLPFAALLLLSLRVFDVFFVVVVVVVVVAVVVIVCLCVGVGVHDEHGDTDPQTSCEYAMTLTLQH